MAPAAAASKSFVLSAMLLSYQRGSLVFAGSGDALDPLQLLYMPEAIPLRSCVTAQVQPGARYPLFARRRRVLVLTWVDTLGFVLGR